MDCQHCEDNFILLLEQDTGLEVEAAKAHLQACPQCRQAWEDYQATVAALHSLPLAPPPVGWQASLSHALEEAAEPVSRLPWWQPVVAGVSMAACLALVLWAVVLSPAPENASVTTADWRPAEVARPAGRPAGNPAVRPSPPRPVGPVAERVASAPRVGRPWPRNGGRLPVTRPVKGEPLWGGWAVGQPEPQTGVAPSGETRGSGGSSGTGQKPAGTFAAGDPPTAEPAAPLSRRTGKLELTFVPPATRRVGEPAVGELRVVGEAEAQIVVSARGRRGLRVGSEGVLYRGALRRGEALTLPVRLVAVEPGTQRLQVVLQSDVPGVAAELEVMIPEFAGERVEVGQRTITANLRGVSARQALRLLAAEAGARVVIHDGVPATLVTHDYSAGVPFEAALRVLCEQVGCRFEARGDVYHVLP